MERKLWVTLVYRGVTYSNYIISVEGHIKRVYAHENLKQFDSGHRHKRHDKVTVYEHGQKINVRIPHAMYESFYGIEVTPGYVIHHIDGDRENNCLCNLIRVTSEEHNKLHNRGRYKA